VCVCVCVRRTTKRFVHGSSLNGRLNNSTLSLSRSFERCSLGARRVLLYNGAAANAVEFVECELYDLCRSNPLLFIIPAMQTILSKLLYDFFIQMNLKSSSERRMIPLCNKSHDAIVKIHLLPPTPTLSNLIRTCNNLKKLEIVLKI